MTGMGQADTLDITTMSRAARRMQRTPAPNQTGGGFVPNLINNPHLGGYPDETNTGVPAGATLTNSGSLTINVNGAVVQNLNINGMITVNANNVTIRNCRITSSDYYPVNYDGATYSGLLVEDSEIIGLTSDVTAGMSFSNYTARRVFVTGTADGFKADAYVLIEDCYVTQLAIGEDTHNDGVQTTGGENVTLRHNTFKLGGQNGISSVVQFGNEWDTNTHWLIENCLIDGGGWSINASNDPSDNPDTTIINNRFTRRAGYGPGSVGGATWYGNIYDDDGSVVAG